MRWMILLVMVGGCAREIPSAAPTGVGRVPEVVARYVKQLEGSDASARVWSALDEARRRGWCDEPAARARQESAKPQAAEADRIVETLPKDARPGQTGAVENARDLQVLARALAAEPRHPHAANRLRAAKTYAANVFSIAGDRTSNALIGEDITRKIVRTANVNNDFTMENGRRFDPAAIAWCAQQLGEAWITLKLGDREHGTNYAQEFEPYALHHVEDSWKNVMRMMFLPNGELALGGDAGAYLAFIATALNDPVAAALEARCETRSVEASASALLHHALRPTNRSVDPALADGVSAARVFRDVDTWVRRNASYFASASWGKRVGGVFRDRAGVTAPLADGILPAGMDGIESGRDVGDAVVLELRLKSGGRAAVISLPNSVLWLSPEPMRALGIRGGLREPENVGGTWVNVGDRFGCIASSAGFRYNGGAVGRLTPPPAARAWLMIPESSAGETRAIAEEFFSQYQDGVMRLTIRDGPHGKHYSIAAPLGADVVAGVGVTVEPLD